MQAERGQEEGASTVCFPLHRQGISFVQSTGWCIPARSSSRIAALCRTSHRGTRRGTTVRAGSASRTAWAAPGRGSGVWHGGHKGLRGCAVLRGVWQQTVFVQSNTGHIHSNRYIQPWTPNRLYLNIPADPSLEQSGASGVHKTAYSLKKAYGKPYPRHFSCGPTWKTS